MNSRECIEKKIEELTEVLSGIDELESVKEKLKKIDKMKELTEDVFKDQEDVYGNITGYVNEEINLQKVIIEELGSKIAQVCGVEGGVDISGEVASDIQGQEDEEKEQGVENQPKEELVVSDTEVKEQEDESEMELENDLEGEVVVGEESEVKNDVVSNEELEQLTDQMLNEIEEDKSEK